MLCAVFCIGKRICLQVILFFLMGVISQSKQTKALAYCPGLMLVISENKNAIQYEMKSTGEAIRFIKDLCDPYFKQLYREKSIYLSKIINPLFNSIKSRNAFQEYSNLKQLINLRCSNHKLFLFCFDKQNTINNQLCG